MKLNINGLPVFAAGIASILQFASINSYAGIDEKLTLIEKNHFRSVDAVLFDLKEGNLSDTSTSSEMSLKSELLDIFENNSNPILRSAAANALLNIWPMSMALHKEIGHPFPKYIVKHLTALQVFADSDSKLEKYNLSTLAILLESTEDKLKDFKLRLFNTFKNHDDRLERSQAGLALALFWPNDLEIQTYLIHAMTLESNSLAIDNLGLAISLTSLSNEKARKSLLSILQSHGNPNYRRAAGFALASKAPTRKEQWNLLFSVQSDPDWTVRIAIILGLNKSIGSTTTEEIAPEVIQGLIKAASVDPVDQVLSALLETLKSRNYIMTPLQQLQIAKSIEAPESLNKMRCFLKYLAECQNLGLEVRNLVFKIMDNGSDLTARILASEVLEKHP